MNSKREYSRVELESLTGFKNDTIIRTLNSLISKHIILKIGSITNIVYCKINYVIEVNII